MSVVAGAVVVVVIFLAFIYFSRLNITYAITWRDVFEALSTTEKKCMRMGKITTIISSNDKRFQVAVVELCAQTDKNVVFAYTQVCSHYDTYRLFWFCVYTCTHKAYIFLSLNKCVPTQHIIQSTNLEVF